MFLNKKKIFIVAEAGNNHEGSLKVAKKLIDKAAFAGADAIKFQTFNVESFVNKKEKKRVKQLNKYSLKINDFKKLSLYAKKKKIIFFSTPLDLKSATKLKKLQKLFKISSGDNNYFDLIKLTCSFGRPIIVSTGLADMKLIQKVYKFLKKNKKIQFSKRNFALLHCVSSYPVPTTQANLLSIEFMKKNFDIVTNCEERTFPKGQSVEILKSKLLLNHYKNFKKKCYLEHLTSYFYSKKKYLISII